MAFMKLINVYTARTRLPQVTPNGGSGEEGFRSALRGFRCVSARSR